MIDKLERIWKKAVCLVELLSWHLGEGTEETLTNHQLG
jgi:hypothetical protein